MDYLFPIFPLGITVLPSERVSLHIFEPRYKQLLSKCINDKSLFVILFTKGSKIKNYGTTVKIDEIKKVYDDGSMDIVVKGEEVVKMTKVIGRVDDDLYHSANFEKLTDNFISTDADVISHFYDLFPTSNFMSVITQTSFPQADLYVMAKKLPLNPAEKYKLISANTLSKKETILLSFLKFYANLKKVELETGNNFMLN
jgi:uncharacterized protein